MCEDDLKISDLIEANDELRRMYDAEVDENLKLKGKIAYLENQLRDANECCREYGDAAEAGLGLEGPRRSRR